MNRLASRRREIGRREKTIFAVGTLVGAVLAALFELGVQNAFHWGSSSLKGAPEALKVEFFPTLNTRAKSTGASHMVVPQPLNDLARTALPKSAFDDDVVSWAKGLGGVWGDEAVVTLKVNAGVPETVVVSAVRIDVLRRTDPITGTHIFQPGAGDLFKRVMTADLDAPTVVATPADWGDHGPWRFPLQVSQQGDTELLVMMFSTRNHYVEFLINIDYIYQGKTRTHVVRDGDGPFKVSSSKATTETAHFSMQQNGRVSLVRDGQPTTTTRSEINATSRTLSCGATASNSEKRLDVTILRGPVSCGDALALVDTYLNNPPETPQGSSGSVHIGPWLCASNSAAGAAMSGRAGGCSRDDTGASIELRTT